MRIERFSEKHHDMWNKFISTSKNGTFLFHRNYMEYHRDRFQDHSLLFFDDKDVLQAVLPANEVASRLDSHGGLTYGGFVTAETMKVQRLADCFLSLLDYADLNDFKEIRYKAIPHIYHRVPAQEDLYSLFLLGASCIGRSVIAAIDSREKPLFQKRRLRQVNSAIKSGLIVQESDDLTSYWNILTALLETIHGTKPVHSLEEMSTLKRLFPNEIRLFAGFLDKEMVAGVLVYESSQVARTQYIASSQIGRSLGAVDLIFDYLVNTYYQNKAYLDFGTSEQLNTANYLNLGLIEQKEGFGGRAVIQDQYLISVNTEVRQQLEKAFA